MPRLRNKIKMGEFLTVKKQAAKSYQGDKCGRQGLVTFERAIWRHSELNCYARLQTERTLANPLTLRSGVILHDPCITEW